MAELVGRSQGGARAARSGHHSPVAAWNGQSGTWVWTGSKARSAATATPSPVATPTGPRNTAGPRGVAGPPGPREAVQVRSGDETFMRLLADRDDDPITIDSAP